MLLKYVNPRSMVRLTDNDSNEIEYQEAVKKIICMVY